MDKVERGLGSHRQVDFQKQAMEMRLSRSEQATSAQPVSLTWHFGIIFVLLLCLPDKYSLH